MNNLKALRKEKKLNQQKVAMDLNISREALSHYENEKRSLNSATLIMFADYYNVSIDYLLGRAQNKI